MRRVCSILVLVCFLMTVFTMLGYAKELKVYNSPTDYRIATGKRITRYNEAPILADLVKQGKLPPVEQRLPKNPVVIEPWEEIGQYGGTWRRCWTGLADRAGPTKIAGYVKFVRLDYTGTKLISDLADKWTLSKDGKEYIFHLREGL
ncbi:ABC transporter substrate-binding protein, partial [bacterium]|nr:ABC transporter substrate-binding protein [bacterium]